MTVVGRSETMRLICASSRRNAAGDQRSNCCEYLRTASSPSERMSASTAATVSTTRGLLLFDVETSAAGALSVSDTGESPCAAGHRTSPVLPADVLPVSAGGHHGDRHIMCSDARFWCTLV